MKKLYVKKRVLQNETKLRVKDKRENKFCRLSNKLKVYTIINSKLIVTFAC